MGLNPSFPLSVRPSVPSSHRGGLSAEALRAPCSAPACCSGQTGSSSASCRRTSGETPPSTDAPPRQCCLGGAEKQTRRARREPPRPAHTAQQHRISWRGGGANDWRCTIDKAACGHWSHWVWMKTPRVDEFNGVSVGCSTAADHRSLNGGRVKNGEATRLRDNQWDLNFQVRWEKRQRWQTEGHSPRLAATGLLASWSSYQWCWAGEARSGSRKHTSGSSDLCESSHFHCWVQDVSAHCW